MGMHTQNLALPEQVMPLIRNCVGSHKDRERMDTLKALATSYLLSRQHPTRLAFNHVSEVLAHAREQGFADPEINRFLAELEKLLKTH